MVRLTEDLAAELEAQRGADVDLHAGERQGGFALTSHSASLIFSQPNVSFHLFVSSPPPTAHVPLISLCFQSLYPFPSVFLRNPFLFKCSQSSRSLFFSSIFIRHVFGLLNITFQSPFKYPIFSFKLPSFLLPVTTVGYGDPLSSPLPFSGGCLYCLSSRTSKSKPSKSIGTVCFLA